MIEPVIADAVPMTPPTRFELFSKPTIQDTWQGDEFGISSSATGRGFCEPRSSSSLEGTLENQLPELPTPTASRTGIAELLTDLFRAEKRSASVKKVNATENVFELRRLTGFTWKQLADLLNVDRRTLHNWVKGGKIRNANQEHIAETLSRVRFADRGSAEENATAIVERLSIDVTAFDAVKAGQYINVRHYLSHGLAGPLPPKSATDRKSWTGEFQPMAMHEDADGSETIEPLPDEPRPMSRTRRIKRG